MDSQDILKSLRSFNDCTGQILGVQDKSWGTWKYLLLLATDLGASKVQCMIQR